MPRQTQHERFLASQRNQQTRRTLRPFPTDQVVRTVEGTVNISIAGQPLTSRSWAERIWNEAGLVRTRVLTSVDGVNWSEQGHQWNGTDQSGQPLQNPQCDCRHCLPEGWVRGVASDNPYYRQSGSLGHLAVWSAGEGSLWSCGWWPVGTTDAKHFQERAHATRNLAMAAATEAVFLSTSNLGQFPDAPPRTFLEQLESDEL